MYFTPPPQFTPLHFGCSKSNGILVTAGVDGDEYSSIEAANQLIKEFSTGINPNYSITIVPIVNLAGYHAKISQNPLDNRFPKYIYPGSYFGSSSSQLMYRLHQLVKQHSLWIDLHGGNSEEILHPFIWTSKTGYPNIDHQTLNHLHALNHPLTIFETIPTLKPSLPLAKIGKNYLLFESGDQGRIHTESVLQLVGWVKTIISSHYRPTKTASNTYQNAYYTKVNYLYSPKDNILPQSYQNLTASTTPQMVLWYKKPGKVKKGDMLVATASKN